MEMLLTGGLDLGRKGPGEGMVNSGVPADGLERGPRADRRIGRESVSIGLGKREFYGSCETKSRSPTAAPWR